MKIISFKICPFVQRITGLLEARNLPYEIEYISLDDKPAWFLEISPNAQVPILVTDDGMALFESDAIAEYLDDIHPPLEPDLSAEQRAMDRAWVYQASKHYLPQCSAMTSKDSDALTDRTKNLAKAFAKIEQQLGDGPYFKGTNLSNVDMAWMVLLYRAHIIKAHTGYDFLLGFPKVQAWQVALMASGLAQRSVSDDFERVFANFYLSEKTYLGRGENCGAPEPVVASGGGCCA